LAATVNGVAMAVTNGLSALHRQALVHGGLKPANIFFDHNEWRLADYSLNVFGNRRFLPITRRVDATFMAPEVLYGGELTPAADVFAFGRVCQWLLERSPSPDWQAQPEYEVFRYVLAQAQALDPRMRPTMPTLNDVLYENGAATRRRVMRLLKSPVVIDEVSREIAAINLQPGETVHLRDVVQHREQADGALSRVGFEIGQKPYLGIHYLDSDTLIRYACVLAMSTFDNPLHRTLRLIGDLSAAPIIAGGVGGGSGSSGQQKRISRGLDGEWRNLILRRYQDAMSSPVQLGEDDPFVTPEMRATLASSPADLFRRLSAELQNASDIRASILEEEALLTASETLALLAQHDPSVTPDDLLQLEASRTIFSINDHGARLYPAFQFDEHGRVFSAISDINKLFGGSTGWGIMVWWRRYHPELGAAPKSALSEANWDLLVSAAKHSLEVD
jgi:serine/threonine protein kinase